MRKIYRKLIILLCMAMMLFASHTLELRAQTNGNEVAILDPELPDIDVLVKGLKPGIKLEYFSKDQNMASSITQVLVKYSPVKSLHILTHGNPAIIASSYGAITLDDLETQEVNSWKNYFALNAEIYLYGCFIADGSIGKQFVNNLHVKTGAGVSASTNNTGAYSQNGDWILEYSSGNISNNLCISDEVKSNYKNILQKVYITYGTAAWGTSGVTKLKTYYNGQGYICDIFANGVIPDLSNYDLVWVVQPGNAISAAEITNLSAHLNKGGRIIFMGENGGYTPTQNNNISNAVIALGAHFSIVNEAICSQPACNQNQKTNGAMADHPIFNGVTTFQDNYLAPIAMGGAAQVLIKANCDQTKIFMAIENVGNGDIVMWADQNWYDTPNSSCNQHETFLKNLLLTSADNKSNVAKATLTTTDAYSISGSGATSGGNITDDKGSTITQRGICWSTTASPTTSNNVSYASSGGTGLFTCAITGLSLNTKYYVRAFAINGNGTAYGNEINFTTPSVANTAPTAVADNFSCQKSGSLSGNVMLNDFDSDGDPMTATIVTQPSYNSGAFTLNANGTFTYTNNGTNAPSDFFSYKLYDGKSYSATVGVGIAIYTPSNPPVSANGSVNVTAGQIFSFSSSNFTFSDADVGHVFNGIKLVSVPSKGLLKYNGFSVAAGSIYNDVTKLTFDNNSQTGGSPFTTFTFKVVASSGEESSSTYTMSVLLTGGKSDQTITFGAIPAAKYGDADIDPGATASSSLAVSYTSATTSVATIVNGKIRIVGVGTSVITASQAGDASYNAAPDVTQTLTVGKANQTITFNALSNATFGDVDLTPGATASSGLSVSYSSGTTAVATIVSGKIHIVGAGSSIITATQSGDGNYNAASSVTQTITVNKANQTITFTSLPQEVYGKVDYNPGATASSGLSVSYESDNTSVASIVSGNIHINGVGTANIKVTQAGNANYNAASDVTKSLEVVKAQLTVTADDKSRIYGEVNPALTVSYSGFVKSETVSALSTLPTVTTSATETSSVGVYSITPSGGTADNYSFVYNSGDLTINQKSLNVTADNKTKVYGDENPELTISITGFVNGDDITFLNTVPTSSTVATKASNVGSYSIIPGNGIDDNYSFVYNNGSLTITKKDLTVTAEDKGKSYGDNNPLFTLSYEGFVNEDNPSMIDTPPSAATTATNLSPVAQYPITLSGGSDNNYNLLLENGKLVVNLRNLTITAVDKVKTYGDANPGLTLTYSGFVNGDNESVLNQLPKISTSANELSNAGDYEITLTEGSDDYYTYFLVNGNLTIDKKEVVVTAEDKSKVYGDSNPNFTFTYSGFVNGDNATLIDKLPEGITSATEKSGVGSYDILPQNALDNNYSFVYINGKLSVTKKDLILNADNKTKIYGESNPELTITYLGFVNDDAAEAFPTAPTIETKATNLSPVGEYPIVLDGGTSDNYTLILHDGTLKVDKKELTVTAQEKTKVYGAANPLLTFVYNGFVNDEDKSVILTEPSISVDANEKSQVKTYPIVLSGGSDENYSFKFENSSLSITKKEIIITADAKYKAVGNENPSFSFTYDGFVNNETSTILNAQPIGTTLANKNSSAGDYDITPSDAFSDNYSFNYIKGTLRITTIAGDKDADGKITAPEVAGDANCDGKITSPELAGDVNGDGKITSPEVAGDTNGDGKITSPEQAGDTNGDGKITSPEVAGDTNGDGKITSPEVAGDTNGDGKITSPEVAGDTNGDGKITSPEQAGDTNGDGNITSPEVAGDINGDGKITSPEVAGDTNGDGKITSPEVAGDTNGDGKITSPEVAGDINGDGKITSPEVAGDLNGDGKITSPEVAGDTNGDGEITSPEIAGDTNGDGKITSPEIAGDTNGDGTITSPEKAGDTNGDGTITSPEILGDINGDGKIDNNEAAGDTNGDGQINSTEVRVIDPAKDHGNIDHLFSPNTDGINDYWKLPKIELYGRVQVKIYNRWGGLVYESSNYQNDWDGTSNGKPVPEGAYFYFLKTEKDGDKSGVINIVR